jgi:hypothetical protein
MQTSQVQKTVTDFDDFNKDVLRCTIFDMYAAGEFPTAEKLVMEMNDDVRFKGSVRSLVMHFEICEI